MAFSDNVAEIVVCASVRSFQARDLMSLASVASPVRTSSLPWPRWEPARLSLSLVAGGPAGSPADHP